MLRVFLNYLFRSDGYGVVNQRIKRIEGDEVLEVVIWEASGDGETGLYFLNENSSLMFQILDIWQIFIRLGLPSY
jgi:hypothetical protein